ncbi:MAG: hypothetical protein D8M57_00075 [Candidatus Scalindua sp. AMX11]|nr:MAG: hypothetical protein DWQ00_18910 [Candidatus Scalindua sp.]TDE66822.1 MAG: hypothetical protein D8M57_00075 [Candidatus Scalindua sp. AMX11]GJQ57621.1 MAG: hypothetical protein SCALA701_04220 [Candidatus Scalindua sp.]
MKEINMLFRNEKKKQVVRNNSYKFETDASLLRAWALRCFSRVPRYKSNPLKRMINRLSF